MYTASGFILIYILDLSYNTNSVPILDLSYKANCVPPIALSHMDLCKIYHYNDYNDHCFAAINIIHLLKHRFGSL